MYWKNDSQGNHKKSSFDIGFWQILRWMLKDKSNYKGGEKRKWAKINLDFV